MKKIKKQWVAIILMSICISFLLPAGGRNVYAASVKLNKTTVNLSKGQTFKLKVKGTTAKVKWKSSVPSVVTVSNKGKLMAIHYGAAEITAKVKNKKLKCEVKVERKGEKNARTLRDYILKNGKKSGGKRYIYKKEYDSEEAEGTTREYKITASAKDNFLMFEYGIITAEPPAHKKVMMKIDLVSGSEAIRTGTAEYYYEDGYGIETWERYYADVTTEFSYIHCSDSEEDTVLGLMVNKYMENESEDRNEITDSTTLSQGKYLTSPSANLMGAFTYWDKLIAGKKALKTAKITMKTLGFRKASY